MLIVAEIGVNWTCLDHATMMMQKAKGAGADAVKFQVYSKEQIKDVREKDPVVFKRLADIMLTRDYIQTLKDRADHIGIEFFATPMFPGAVDWLEQVGVKRYKIREHDNHYWELIERVDRTGKESFISAERLDLRLDTMRVEDGQKFLYCVPQYPPPLNAIHLDTKLGSLETFYGYSNHYPEIVPALVAVARGAEYVEIHVEDSNWKFDMSQKEPIDHAVSWTFDKLDQFVKIAREMEAIR
jgi:sialic acid synthase SpsE